MTSGLFQTFFHPADPLCPAAIVNLLQSNSLLISIFNPILSYIRDSSHFKCLLNNLHIESSDILFTLDVESLYSIIPIQQDIASVKKPLLEHPCKGRPDKYLSSLNSLCFVMTFNLARTSFFKSKALPWAKNTFPHLPIFSCTSGNNKLFLPPILLPSFGNGTLMTFLASGNTEIQLHNFLQHLNSINPNIKAILTCSSSNINFLDCTVFKHNNHLATKIYSKPTERLLHFNSCHPRHVFESIVKVQILRFLLILKTSLLPIKL